MIALVKTYALRMAAVFMISLATIWLKTGSDAEVVGRVHLSGGGLAADRAATSACGSTLAFPIWVLVVSLLALTRAGVIDLHCDD